MFSFFGVGTTFFAVPPLVGELISRFGISHFEVGLLMGAIAVPAVFLSIPLGLAVDRWPARRSGEAALGIMFGGGVLFALAPNFPLLFLGRFCFGLGGLLLNLILARLLSEAFEGRELGLAMGLFMAVYPAAMVVVFLVHPPAAALLGWRMELLALAGIVLFSWPLYRYAVPSAGGGRENSGEKQTVRGVLSRSLVALSLAWMLFFAAFSAVLTFAPEWLGGSRGLRVVSLVMWVSLVASPLFGSMMRVRIRRWLFGGLLLFAFMLLLMGRVPVIPLMLGTGLAAALVPTSSYALPARIVHPARVGLAFGIMTALSNLGTLLGPSLAGAVRDATGSWSFSWLFLGLGVLLASMLSLMIREGEGMPKS